MMRNYDGLFIGSNTGEGQRWYREMEMMHHILFDDDLFIFSSNDYETFCRNTICPDCDKFRNKDGQCADGKSYCDEKISEWLNSHKLNLYGKG